MDDWWCSLDDDGGHHGQDIERLRLRWVIELIMAEEASNMTPSDNHNNNNDGSNSGPLWTDRPGKDPVATL